MNIVQRALAELLNKKQAGITVPSDVLEQMAKGVTVADVQASLPDSTTKLIKIIRQVVKHGSVDPNALPVLQKVAKAHVVVEEPSDPDVDPEILFNWIVQLLLGDKEGLAWIDETYNAQASKEVSGFLVTKGLDGGYYWFGWATNKWEDREGEILTDAAHRDFLNYLDENPDQAPELWSWHTPGTAREAKADWWDYANGFFLYGGPLTEAEARPYLDGTIKTERIGMSHGFYVLERNGRFITKYRTFEVSELPHDVAANPFTEFSVMREESMKFSDRKRAFLVSRHGEETVEKLEAAGENREKVLEELGINWKETSDAYEAELEAQFAQKVAAATEPAVKQVVTQVLEALNVEGLQTALKGLYDEVQAAKALQAKVEELQAEVTALKATEDSRIAEALTPAAPFEWGFSVQQAKAKPETVEAAKKQATGEMDWLANLNPFGGGN